MPTAAEREELTSWAGCVAGTLQVEEYLSKLEAAGFVEVGTQLGEEPGERGWTSAYVIARKPS